jgi:murein DD-endopeptidase MepM/ murein hydrolase activator NlpD
MSYTDCVARITQLDSLVRGVDPNWAKSGNSMINAAGTGLVSGDPFSGVLEQYATKPAVTSTAASVSASALNSYASFSSPLPGSTVTQAFGPTSLDLEPPATVDGVSYAHFHDGVDRAAPLGSSVLAAASGTVTYAGRQSDGAVVVKIKHDNGYTSLYAHLDPALSVSVGQQVSAGQAIGKVGLTGNTTGPHLHFGLYTSAGTAVDPSVSLTTGHMPDPSTLLAPTPGDPGSLSAVSGSAVLARFDAVSSRIPYAAEIRSAAVANGMDPALLASLVYAESGFNAKAVSSCGAQGLTQLMPGTARGLGVTDSFDPQQNLNGGAQYIARQLKSFGRVDLALAAYNAGPGAIARLGVVPDSKQGYVNRILGKWNSYQEASA